MSGERSPWFMPLILAGGLIFGFGLATGGMTRPEVVLSFLQLSDLGLLSLMASASITAGAVFHLLGRSGRSAPLTGRLYGLRRRSFDRNTLVGGAVFGVGWGLSGICPGAAYASLGVGNLPILWGIAGMFVGAYLQGRFRTSRERAPRAVSAD